MEIEAFHHRPSATLSYVVFDPSERVGVVIDPVLDFEAASGATSTRSAERVARFIDERGLRVPFVLDTHAHADHMSALPFFAERYDAETVIGREITRVQKTFRDLFHLGDAFPVDGSQFDRLLDHEERLDVGAFEIEALHTPGHTPACLTYRIGDALFVGDTLFQPDYGTARCDFPGGSAEMLWRSIRRLYDELPDETRIFTCHDYQPGGRPVAYESTLAEQRGGNVQLDGETSCADFVEFRSRRDATLGMPDLILPSIQVNIRAGRMPEAESNGVSYLKLPVDAFPYRGEEDDDA